jgi:putative addiction module component (TIGR02574 family)
MKLSPDQLEAELLQLPAHVRARLAEALLASLDELDSELDVAWADEAERRAAQLESGQVAAIPAAEARAGARSKLR